MRVALVAGEASGDLLGAALISALREHYPAASFEGIAGPRMLKAGCTTAFPMERLSVMGLVEVLGRYLELLPARKRLVDAWLKDPPDVFVGIDAPDFNLDIEVKLRAQGIPVVHYVSPSVWAWRRYRLRKIRRAVDKMLCLFPFEPELYEANGIDAEFVGHPLGEVIPAMSSALRRAGAREQLGVARQATVVALLPGSRTTEIGRLARPMLHCAHWLERRVPGLQFLLPLANETCRQVWFETNGSAPDHLDLRLLEGQSLEAMAAADVVISASGTATLEAMLLGRPLVITYRTHEATWQIGKRLLHVPFVGLPNLLAGRALVPELLQHAGTPAALGAAALRFLRSPELCAQVEHEFDAIAATLRRDASHIAAASIAKLLGEGNATGDSA